MVNSSDVALIVSVESNENNINLMTKTISVRRFYEDEAIRCFRAWRKNGGWLKDIDIYCVCPSKNTIKQTTRDEFKKLDVEYIEYFDENIFDYSSGFLTLPFVGQLFENKVSINQNILIKIDLDMQLLKPLPVEWFNMIELGYTVVGQYDVYSIRDQRNTYRNFLPFDTGLMITDKRNMFCDLWYKLCFKDYVIQTDQWKQTKIKFGDYYLEEFVIDYIYANKLAKIFPVQRYQYGEGYASLSTFSDDEFANLYFLHEHLYKDKRMLISDEYNSVNEKMIYLKKHESH